MTGAAVSATSIAPPNDADALPAVSVDVIKALSLAYRQPDSTAARKVAERLRQRVDELLPAATGYVKSLPKGSAPQDSGKASLSVAAGLGGYRAAVLGEVLAGCTSVSVNVVLYALAQDEEQLRDGLVRARAHAQRQGWRTAGAFFDLAPELPVPQRPGWALARHKLAGGFAHGAVSASMSTMATGVAEYEEQLVWCHNHLCFVDLAEPESCTDVAGWTASPVVLGAAG